MYSMKMACVNCHHTQTRRVSKGVTLETWLESKPKCTVCDCEDTLQTIHEYSIRKKMFEDYLHNESHGHHQEQNDETGHSHYA